MFANQRLHELRGAATRRDGKIWRSALNIYGDRILREAQNPEKQILYWVENGEVLLNDKFKCLAYEREGAIVGYAQYSYFSDENIIFFEYFCVTANAKGQNLTSAFIELLRSHVFDKYNDQVTIVFETAHTPDPNSGWVSDKALNRYFRRFGFRKLNFDYFYPVLQSYVAGTSYPADLLIATKKGEIEFNSYQVRTILRAIYFKHYLRWDKPFLSSAELIGREKLINSLYNMHATKIQDDDKISTSGGSAIDFSANFRRSTSFITTALTSDYMKRVSIFLFSLLIVSLVNHVTDSMAVTISSILIATLIYGIFENSASSNKLVLALVGKLRFRTNSKS
jgi:hypothetical protein